MLCEGTADGLLCCCGARTVGARRARVCARSRETACCCCRECATRLLCSPQWPLLRGASDTQALLTAASGDWQVAVENELSATSSTGPRSHHTTHTVPRQQPRHAHLLAPDLHGRAPAALSMRPGHAEAAGASTLGWSTRASLSVGLRPAAVEHGAPSCCSSSFLLAAAAPLSGAAARRLGAADDIT